MKKLILVLGLFAAVSALPTFAGSSCDDVKASIAKKIDGKGVKNYTLDVVATADVKDQKVVGNCASGSKKIVYMRGAEKAAKAEAKVEAKAEAKVEAKAEAKAEVKAAEPVVPAKIPELAPAMKGPAMTKPAAK